MALSPGTRLGPYEVAAPIGAGGMGEVYRATDTKLKRQVAIKVLPESLATDTERLARFQREAETLAALNHPGIAQIYGLEESDGTKALVMELVDGPTLAERIARGPVPLDEALSTAKQIAEALAAAHDRGIIHRDLKPANIKLRPDGTVKVLDFGLAKAIAADGAAEAAVTAAPTALTEQGIVLGTPAYMSPEQVRGLAVDRRADVWAFGCVLLEMLAGRRLFDGESAAAVAGQVLSWSPDRISLPSTTPAPLVSLLRRCLQPDAAARRRSLGDVALELDDLRAAAKGGESTMQAAGRTGAWAAVVVLAVVVVGLVAWMALGGRGGAATVTRFEVTPPDGFPFVMREYTRDLAISPDGRRIAYVSNQGSIVVRDLESFDVTRLRDLNATTAPAFSADGAWLSYLGGGLQRVSIQGGTPETIRSGFRADTMGDTSWTDDGDLLLTDVDGLWRVPVGGGEPALVVASDAATGARPAWPEALPGGAGILYTNVPAGSLQAAEVAVWDPRSGQSRVLVRGASQPRYVPSGHLVYAAPDGALYAVPFDLDTLVTRGDPVQVVADVQVNENGSANYDVSDDGTLIYAPKVLAATDRRLAWVARDGTAEVLSAPPANYVYPRLSPDGLRVAIDVRQPEADVWLWDFVREVRVRFTADPWDNPLAIWSPDGARIAYGDRRGGVNSAYWNAVDAAGEAERLADGLPLDFTPDGGAIVIGDGGNLSLLSLDGTGRLERLAGVPANATNARVSPDGRWLAFQMNVSEVTEVFVVPFPDTAAGRWQISSGGGSKALWSRDGSELFYIDPSPALVSVPVSSEPTFSPGPRATLFDMAPYGPLQSGSWIYDVGPDGRFLMQLERGDEATTPRIAVVLNWFTELERLVPTE